MTDRLPRIAARVVLTASIVLAVVEVWRIERVGTASEFLVALAATAVFLPLHAWHLTHGMHGERPPLSGATLAAMAVAHITALLIIGPAWSFMLAVLATSALIVLPARWAALAFVLCALGPLLARVVQPDLSAAFGASLGYLIVAVVFRSAVQFALVWLVATAHQLSASRAALAAAATERERGRIEAEVRTSLEQRMAALGMTAQAARVELAGPGVASALVATDRAVALSRDALTDLRRIVADARKPGPHQAADALVDAARSARAPIRGVVRAAWLPALAVQSVVAAFVLLSALGAFQPGPPDASPAVIVGAWLASVTLFGTLSLDVARGRVPRHGHARLAVLAALCIALLEPLGPYWTVSLWFVGAAMGLVLAPRLLVPLGAAGTVAYIAYDASLAIDFFPGMSVADLVWTECYTVAIFAVAILGLYASTRLTAVVEELEASRDALAVEATSAERRRLSSDLHDVLGQSLTAIALKGDLARRLLEAGRRDAAAAELDVLIALATRQAGEVEAVTRDERAVALDAEADNAVALLRSAGIAVSVALDAGDLDDEAQTVLGWAIREGTTNVLRHAAAQRCDLRVWRENGAIRLELVNDGALGRAADGTGLAAIGERSTSRGGTAAGEPLPGGRFRLRVELPDAVLA